MSGQDWSQGHLEALIPQPSSVSKQHACSFVKCLYGDGQMVASGPSVRKQDRTLENGKWRIRTMASSDGALRQMSPMLIWRIGTDE